jgi:putative ABC transport system ATP-binding protein
MIEIKQVSKIYKNCHALNDISLTIKEGEFISILGESGSGKSTLLYLIGGMIYPDKGNVLFDEVDIYKMSEQDINEFRKKRVGFVFQQFHLLPYLNVHDNIKLGCNSSEDIKGISDILLKFNLIEKKNNYPFQLSVGEKQRVAFSRAIISDPDIILADEPTGNLDEKNGKVMLEHLKDFNSKGKTVILVTHDKSAASYAAKKIQLTDGKIKN